MKALLHSDVVFIVAVFIAVMVTDYFALRLLCFLITQSDTL
jgi:hypothetical protein